MAKPDEDVSIGGIFCGKRVKPGLYAEEVASRRYVIRRLTSTDLLHRVGEVMGSQGRFQSMAMNGDHVKMCSSLVAAAERLIKQF